jgi:two-component sensor histidine kinase
MKTIASREPAGPMTILPATIDLQESDEQISDSLRLISAILALQARDSKDPDVFGALTAAMHRVSAIGAVHWQINRSNTGNVVDIAACLFEIALGLERGSSAGPARRQVRAHVEPAMVSAPFARALAQLMTELVMDACTRAYRPDQPGMVDVCLFFPQPSEFWMEVRDYGGVPDLHVSRQSEGLGAQLVELMSRRLDATCAYAHDPEGMRISVRGTVEPVVG